MSSFLQATGVSCTGFTSTPFKSARQQNALLVLDTLILAATRFSRTRDGRSRVAEWAVTFDADGHVRVDALPGVLQPDLLDLQSEQCHPGLGG